jgi:hypothetical protein
MREPRVTPGNFHLAAADKVHAVDPDAVQVRVRRVLVNNGAVNPPLRTQIFYQVAHNKRPIVFLALIDARARKTHFGVGCWWLLLVAVGGFWWWWLLLMAVIGGCWWWLLVVVVVEFAIIVVVLVVVLSKNNF